MKDGVRQTLEWIKGIDFDGRSQFDNQPRKTYTYYDQNDSSIELMGGYYRHHENFTVLVVPGAGHMVAASQPYLSMKIVMDYVKKGHLSCETISSGNCKSMADDMCDYMNDCNGQGTCSSSTNGKCVCDTGYYGADCSSTVDALTSSTSTYLKSPTGYRWKYFSVPASSDAQSVYMNSDRAVSVYIRMGLTDLPDVVNFDAVIKG